MFISMFVLACISTTFVPPPTPPNETISREALGTLVAGTSNAARIQTASSQPTVTPTFTVTRIPSETFTSTPTFIYLLPTATLVPSYTSIIPVGNIIVNGTIMVDERLTDRPWSCLVTGSTPARNVPQKQGASFYVTWAVMNTGTRAWLPNEIDFVYEAGYGTDQPHRQDLGRAVPSGGSTGLKVLLKAPKRVDTYNVIWALKVGNKSFCHMKLVFSVE